MMSHFATTACEIAQHVRISDETGTAEQGGLFNQENVPADTLFYSVLSATKSRVPDGEFKGRPDIDAINSFVTKVEAIKVFQFGGDASTGLGFTSVSLAKSPALS
jgi:CRISPR-associated protein Cmr4